MNCEEYDEEDFMIIRAYKLKTINEILYADHIEILKRGDLSSLIKLELETGIVSNSYVCEKAALEGKLDIVKHTHFYGAQLNDKVTFNACTSGNISLLEFLHKHKCVWHVDCIPNAARNNKLEAVKYLYSIGLSYSGSQDLISIAIGVSNLDMITFFHEKGFNISSNYVSANIIHNDEEKCLKILEYLYDHHLTFSLIHYYLACTTEKRKVVKWLYDKGCPTKYNYSEDPWINKFQHDIGDLSCEINCIYCYIDRMKEVMRLLQVEEGYGLWLSSKLIKEVTNQLV